MTASSASTDQKEEQSSIFLCPYCGWESHSEHLVRAHITRPNDEEHKNRDGFGPETNIIQKSPTGETTRVERKANEISKNNLSLDEVPDEFSDQHRVIIYVAAMNPHEDNYSELENRVNAALEQRGFSTLSYSTIRRVTHDFFQSKNMVSNTTSTSHDSTEQIAEDTHDQPVLKDATTLQQAVILGKVLLPDDTPNTEIAERANDCAQSYPGQILEPEKFRDEYEMLSDVRDKPDMSIIDFFKIAITEDHWEDLVDDGLAESMGFLELLPDGVDTPFNVRDDQDTRSEDSPATAEDSQGSTGTPKDTEQKELTDGPTTSVSNIFTAGPEDITEGGSSVDESTGSGQLPNADDDEEPEPVSVSTTFTDVDDDDDDKDKSKDDLSEDPTGISEETVEGPIEDDSTTEAIKEEAAEQKSQEDLESILEDIELLLAIEEGADETTRSELILRELKSRVTTVLKSDT